jgi:hypothetical protein
MWAERGAGPDQFLAPVIPRVPEPESSLDPTPRKSCGNLLKPAVSGQSDVRRLWSRDARRTSVHPAVALGRLPPRERESLCRLDTFNRVCVLAHVRGALKIKG